MKKNILFLVGFSWLIVSSFRVNALIEETVLPISTENPVKNINEPRTCYIVPYFKSNEKYFFLGKIVENFFVAPISYTFSNPTPEKKRDLLQNSLQEMGQNLNLSLLVSIENAYDTLDYSSVWRGKSTDKNFCCHNFLDYNKEGDENKEEYYFFSHRKNGKKFQNVGRCVSKFRRSLHVKPESIVNTTQEFKVFFVPVEEVGDVSKAQWIDDSQIRSILRTVYWEDASLKDAFNTFLNRK